MKKSTLLKITSLLTVGLIVGNLETSQTHPNSPDWGYCGAPTESTCGKSTCHNTTPNTFSGTLNVSFDQPYYKPDSTYVVTVTTAESGMSRFGFEASILNSTNTDAGSLSLINVNNTSIHISASGRDYTGHKSAGSNNTWTFSWQAPSSNIGDVTLYVASLCANNNGHETGDHCYTTSLVFQPNPFNTVEGISGNESFVTVQNPVADKLFVSYNSKNNSATTLRLLDVNGKQVEILMNENQSSGIHTQIFNKPSVAGLYFLEFINGNNRKVKKVIVL